MPIQTSENKSTLTQQLFGKACSVFFWSYKRGTLPYDIMCLTILMFIFLIPANFFHDKPSPDNKLKEVKGNIHRIHHTEENSVLSISSESLSINQDKSSLKQFIQEQLEKFLDKSIVISSIEPVADKNGKTISYLVWVKER